MPAPPQAKEVPFWQGVRPTDTQQHSFVLVHSLSAPYGL